MNIVVSKFLTSRGKGKRHCLQIIVINYPLLSRDIPCTNPNPKSASLPQPVIRFHNHVASCQDILALLPQDHVAPQTLQNGNWILQKIIEAIYRCGHGYERDGRGKVRCMLSRCPAHNKNSRILPVANYQRCGSMSLWRGSGSTLGNSGSGSSDPPLEILGG